MKQKFLHVIDVVVIVALASYILLDTFVIPRSYQTVTATTTPSSTNKTTSSEITDTSYIDDNVSIQITTTTYDNTQIYVADVQIKDSSYLQTAFANQTYGKNITDTTSSITESVNGILAINGDYYGARNTGYVIRNGVLYRDTVTSSSQQDLVINEDGSLSIIEEGSTSVSSLLSNQVQQVFSFGPGLIENGNIIVTSDQEVGKAMASNPRTAICEIEPLHYLFVVADGRTEESEGLSLLQLATYLKTLGVTTAYNLDGGGSSTMVFNGKVINQPTTTGNHISERSVSDIVYIQA